MNRIESIFLWMMFLLATNTGVLLTMLRERIYFRRLREEIAQYLPPGYDPKRLDYPYLFDFLTPPSWKDALARHVESFTNHPARKQWLQFRTLRLVLMVVELLAVLAFVVWMLLR